MSTPNLTVPPLQILEPVGEDKNLLAASAQGSCCGPSGCCG